MDAPLYHWDNGSSDGVSEYVASLARYTYPHLENIGYAKAVNQLMMQAYDDGAEYILVLDPDIRVKTPGWVRRMVEVASQIPNTGVAGLYCEVFGLHPLQNVNGVDVHLGNPFGPKMWHRSAIDQIGWLCEEYGLYGLEDNDWICRLECAGRVNYYVPGVSGTHDGDDVGDNSSYRQMKWDCIRAVGAKHVAYCDAYRDGSRPLYIPAPESLL